MRNAIALATDFDAPEIVSEVYAPELPTDGDGEFIDMIEEEACRVHVCGSHVYLHGSLRCCACETAHPSIRNACGQP